MADMQFNCGKCGKSLIVDQLAAGKTVTCPQCGASLEVPGRAEAGQEPHRLDVDFGDAYGMQSGDTLGVGAAISEFRKLDYGFLVPVSKIFSGDILNRRAVRWILLFGLLPLVFAWVARTFSLAFDEILWLLLVYFCLFWALYFYSLVRPSRDNWIRGIGYAVFTATVGMALLFAAQRLPVLRSFYAVDFGSLSLLKRLFGFVFVVGILEETCKALPLIIFGLRKGTIRGVRDGVFVGLLSGLGFAAAEGVQYVMGATGTALATGSPHWQILTILDRVVSGPLQHGTWAGIAGWFIGVAARREEGARWPIVAVGIGLTAVLHGFFNTFSNGLLGIAIAAVGFIAFMAYLIHGEQETDAAAQVVGGIAKAARR